MIIPTTTALYCLFIAVMLPYLLAGGSVYFRIKQFGSVNVNQPRAQAGQLEGPGARIVAAQLNAWEALLVFAAALFIANIMGVDAKTINLASAMFISARVLHALFYIAGQAPLRSLSFIVAFGSCLWLFIAALF